MDTFSCDGNEANANLRSQVDSPPEGTRGQVFTKVFNIFNHGPGDAQNVIFSFNIPKNTFLESVTPSQGTCNFVGKKLNCILGNLLVDVVAGVDLNLIPLKTGTDTTTYNVNADNMGKVFAKKTTVKTPIVAGSGAILDLSAACKGASGDVTISPDASGGTATCTCPDPQNPSRDNYRCAVQNYLVPTQVTVTATATNGQFKKWDKDCSKEKSNSCVVHMDGVSSKPFRATRAFFTP
jgi:hypothetical protein